MINILPEQGIQAIKREYRSRLAVVCLFAAAVACLTLSALLFPSYLISKGSLEEITLEEARMATLAKERSENTDIPLARAKEEIDTFGPLLAKTAPSTRIEKLLSAKHAGVQITVITTDGVGKAVQLSGAAATRDSLLLFVQAIRALPEVASAELPVSDLAKSTNVPFSLQVLLKELPKSP